MSFVGSPNLSVLGFLIPSVSMDIPLRSSSSAAFTVTKNSKIVARFTFDGGDSGIRTPDLRIMMKIAPIFCNKINGLQEPNLTV